MQSVGQTRTSYMINMQVLTKVEAKPPYTIGEEVTPQVYIKNN